MSEDRTEQDEQERVDGQEKPSRPATAAARRERRAGGGRPVGRAGADSPAATAPDAKGRPTPSGRREERVSPVAKAVRFLREVVAELRKVIWPTRKELVTYTIVVLIFVSFMVALVGMLDVVFAKGVFWLFG